MMGELRSQGAHGIHAKCSWDSFPTPVRQQITCMNEGTGGVPRYSGILRVYTGVDCPHPNHHSEQCLLSDSDNQYLSCLDWYRYPTAGCKFSALKTVTGTWDVWVRRRVNGSLDYCSN